MNDLLLFMGALAIGLYAARRGSRAAIVDRAVLFTEVRGMPVWAHLTGDTKH